MVDVAYFNIGAVNDIVCTRTTHPKVTFKKQKNKTEIYMSTQNLILVIIFIRYFMKIRKPLKLRHDRYSIFNVKYHFAWTWSVVGMKYQYRSL